MQKNALIAALNIKAPPNQEEQLYSILDQTGFRHCSKHVIDLIELTHARLPLKFEELIHLMGLSVEAVYKRN